MKAIISNFLINIGGCTVFFIRICTYIPSFKKRWYEILKQFKRIGWDSLPLILITSAFTGFVTAVQASYQTKGLIPKSMLGVLVGKSVMTELAPVLTALVSTGKVGASIAAEIGSMKVTEQIDALETMAIDPIDFLYMPRVVAGAIMMPVLTILSITISLFSAYLLSNYTSGVSFYGFFNTMKNYFVASDIYGALVKSFFFGITITTVGCFAGSKTQGGAEGFGSVATNTVIYSAIMILVMDFVVATVLFGGL